MTTGVLTSTQIESFVENGYCQLTRAFTKHQADAACEHVWRRIAEKAGIRKSDPQTWPESYDIEEHLSEGAVLECFTDRLCLAIEQLEGKGRWCGERRWGLWPVNFWSNTALDYDYPLTGWHVDGNWFKHTLTCPKQGLLVIGLFTDIEPRWGGTILALGSHKITARVLANHPEGLTHHELFDEALKEPLGNFHEVTGAAGDVVLAHPFIFHTRGMKHGGPPRIISNTEAGLREPMNLARHRAEDYSILEQSIICALRSPQNNLPLHNARMCRF